MSDGSTAITTGAKRSTAGTTTESSTTAATEAVISGFTTGTTHPRRASVLPTASKVTVLWLVVLTIGPTPCCCATDAPTATGTPTRRPRLASPTRETSVSTSSPGTASAATSTTGDDKNTTRFDDGCAATTTLRAATITTTTHTHVEGGSSRYFDLRFHECAAAPGFDTTATGHFHFDLGHSIRDRPGAVLPEFESDAVGIRKSRRRRNHQRPRSSDPGENQPPGIPTATAPIRHFAHSQHCQQQDTPHQLLAPN